ncbi:MAG: hypothetical protein ACUVXJ_07130 [Phycisphaerae bacterium]
MTSALADMLHAQPFRPFRIHLATGRQLDVRHPDFLSRSPGGRSAVVWKSEECFKVIDLPLVASL